MFLLALIAYSCNSRKSLNAAEYVRYFGQATESHKIQTTAIDYQLILVTPECIAAREVLLQEKRFDVEAYNKRLKDIEDNTYVFVRLYSKSDNAISKERQVLYYQQYAQKQMRLIADDNKELAPEYVNYEDSYGLAPYNTIVVCFNHSLRQIEKAVQFVYDDALYGNSNIRLSYSRRDIDAFPQLKI